MYIFMVFAGVSLPMFFRLIKPDPTLQPICKMVCDLSRCRSMLYIYMLSMLMSEPLLRIDGPC